jgi:hypothetical protein
MTATRGKPQGRCDAFNAHDRDRPMSFSRRGNVMGPTRGDKWWGMRLEGKQAERCDHSSLFQAFRMSSGDALRHYIRISYRL